MPHALFCGLCTLDVTQHVERVPKANEKVVASVTSIDVGGPATNAARTASALGVTSTLLTPLGSGPASTFVSSMLGDLNIVPLGLHGDLPVSSVLADADGSRSVASSNLKGRRITELSSNGIEQLLESADVVEVDGHVLNVQIPLAKAARARDIPVVLDGGSYKEGLTSLLPFVTHALISADFFMPDGETVDELCDLGIPFVAQSHGSTSIEIHAPSRQSIDIDTVDVVDSLGAGDVLHGAFAAFLSRGYDQRAALERAAAIATISVQHPGALGWAHR